MGHLRFRYASYLIIQSEEFKANLFQGMFYPTIEEWSEKQMTIKLDGQTKNLPARMQERKNIMDAVSDDIRARIHKASKTRVRGVN